MYYKECKSAKCEYLKKVKGGYKCLDCKVDLQQVYNCGIVDDYIESLPKVSNKVIAETLARIKKFWGLK